ncbi:MAG: NTP transferase domain-containing protein [Candidatus Fermentibacter sp.]|nr:NTP transferase domain-containing protein [Candidatus Fermentibacter sp.]
MTAAVILAAGAGKRMHSDLPKVMHPVLGRPMVLRVADMASSCGFDRIVAVVGHGRERLIPLLEDCGIGWVVQERQLGTAHAVSCATGSVAADEYAILLGDVPLLRAETVVSLMEARRSAGASMAVLTAEAPDPAGYGRIVRKSGNLVDRIVEERDADARTRQIREINTGVMAFEGRALAGFIGQIGNDNAQGEFYLTDAAALASAGGLGCAACLARDWEEVAGVNDPFQLAEASRALSRRNVERLTAAGVRFTDPSGVWVEDGVTASGGSEIGRFARLSGATSLGEGSVVGDGSILEDATVPSGAVLPPYTVILRGGGLG